MSEPRKPAFRDGMPWTLGLVALFVCALLWKLYCLNRLVSSPLFPNLSADSATYWAWSKLIGSQGGVGQNPFFLGPLYPYWLAALGLNGSGPAPALLVQCVLGACSVVFIALAAERVGSRSSALVVGTLAAGYSLPTFFDLSVLSESLQWFLGSAFLMVELRFLGLAPRKASACIGGIVGLLALARPSYWLLLLAHGVSSTSQLRRRQASEAITIAALVVGLMAIPTLVRHRSLGHGWIPITYSSGFNFYVGNGRSATGTYTPDMDDRRSVGEASAGVEGGVLGDGRDSIEPSAGSLSAAASSNYWFLQAKREIAASPGHFFSVIGRKLLLSLNAIESSQVENLRVHERLLGPYGLPFLGAFGFVGVLGLFGLYACIGRAGSGVVLACFLANWLPMIIFFVVDRYRVHAVLPMLVACAPAIERLNDLRRDTWRSRIGPLLVLIGAMVLVWFPLVPHVRAQVEFEAHRTAAEALIREGKISEAEAELERCVDPAMLAKLPLDRMRAARSAVADANVSLALLYERGGRLGEAEQALSAALALVPDQREARLAHVRVLALLGSGERSLEECFRFGIGRDELLALLLRAASDSEKQQAWEAMERALRAVLLLEPSSEPGNVVLIRLLRSQGRDAEAHALWMTLPSLGLAGSVIDREGLALGFHGRRVAR